MESEREEAARKLAEEYAKPEYWWQSFGNDWLDNFYEVDIPDQSYNLWLISPSTLIFLSLLLILLLTCWWHMTKLKRRVREYRRVALNLLAEVETSVEQPMSDYTSLRKVPLLLKHCCLFLGGNKVAALVDAEFYLYMKACLNSNVGTESKSVFMSQQDLKDIFSWSYIEDTSLAQLEHSKTQELLQKTRYWLEHHEVALALSSADEIQEARYDCS